VVDADITARNRRLRTLRSNLVQDFQKDIREDYIICEGELGSAAMGCVVRSCIKKKNQQTFALKSFDMREVSQDQKKVRKMLNDECILLRSLDHPNIIRPFQTYETKTEFHLVMELCTGLDLGDRCFRDVGAREVIRKLCNVIAYIHSQGICHRDLKTENILFDNEGPDGDIKLIDFGMSRRFYKEVEMTERLGTPYCMAPEVFEGHYTEKCDMWSIGVIAFKCLTGQHPFNGDSDAEIITNMLSLNWKWPEVPKVHDDAKEFVDNLLKFNPNHRWSAQRALISPWLTTVPNPAKLQRMLSHRRERVVSGIAEGPGTIWEQRLAPTQQFGENMIKSMRDFSQCTLLQRTALMMVAYELHPSQLTKLRHAFCSFDTEMRGVITKEEFTAALRHMKVKDDEIDVFFKSINTGRDGTINYCEFLAATIFAMDGTGGKGLVKDKLVEMFERFDVDHTGKISIASLGQILGESYSDKTIRGAIKEADFKHKGYLDFEEFKIYMEQISNGIQEERRQVEDLQIQIQNGSFR